MNKHLIFASACIRCGFYSQATYHLRKALGFANREGNRFAASRIMTALNLTRNR